MLNYAQQPQRTKSSRLNCRSHYNWRHCERKVLIIAAPHLVWRVVFKLGIMVNRQSYYRGIKVPSKSRKKWNERHTHTHARVSNLTILSADFQVEPRKGRNYSNEYVTLIFNWVKEWTVKVGNGMCDNGNNARQWNMIMLKSKERKKCTSSGLPGNMQSEKIRKM